MKRSVRKRADRVTVSGVEVVYEKKDKAEVQIIQIVINRSKSWKCAMTVACYHYLLLTLLTMTGFVLYVLEHLY